MTKTVEERLRQRAAFARREGECTALCDALHFEEAADQIKNLREALKEARQWVNQSVATLDSLGVVPEQNAGRPVLARIDAALKRAEAKS